MRDDSSFDTVVVVIYIIIAAFLVLLACAIYYSFVRYDGPSPEEIQNLENALPDGCVSHDIGSYGKIDNLVIIECNDRKVSAAYTYMQETRGKSTEIDRAATFVIQ